MQCTGAFVAAVPWTVGRFHGVPEVQGLLNGVRRRHVVVEEGVSHIVLKQGPQARSTARKRKMHDIANKFVDGRHGTSPGWRPISPSSPVTDDHKQGRPSTSRTVAGDLLRNSDEGFLRRPLLPAFSSLSGRTLITC
jgi:hypothetical protein